MSKFLIISILFYVFYQLVFNKKQINQNNPDTDFTNEEEYTDYEEVE